MPETRTNSLLIELERESRIPLHRQIETSIRDGVRSGRLRLGSRLPATRTAAAELGISRGVVVEAYQQLVAEGYLTSRPGGYTEVAAGAEPERRRPPPAGGPGPAIDFGYGRADVSSFPRRTWLRSLRRVLTETPGERFGYLSGRGVPELREALADYLNRVRGASADPDAIVICNGYAQGVALLIGVLARRGARRLAVEDPSSGDDAVPAARGAGLDVVGVGVGEHGIDVGALMRTGADVVAVTPSHQWPTGALLSPSARAALLEWASRTGALIVEDDYDAEYRYDREPVGALQGLAPDRVVYAGTASKTLAPGLRLAWMVLPRELADEVADAKILADRGSPALEQLAFADFLARGEFDRHLRRMRLVYRRRRDALLGALRERLPELEPAGIAAGMHLVAWLPPGLDEQTVVEAAAARGLGVCGIAPYRLEPAARGGLIFGYATLSEREINQGVALLADAIAGLRGHAPAAG